MNLEQIASFVCETALPLWLTKDAMCRFLCIANSVCVCMLSNSYIVDDPILGAENPL